MSEKDSRYWTALPCMTSRNSVVLHEDYRVNPSLNGLSELKEFAECRGYHPRIAARLFNLCLRSSDCDLKVVDDYDDYRLPSDKELRQSPYVRLLSTPDARAKQWKIVMRSLHWWRTAWDIEDEWGAGKEMRKFTDDLLAHAYPHDRQRCFKDAYCYTGMGNDKLLDVLCVKGEVNEVVSDQALYRFARSLGYMPPRMPYFSQFFEALPDVGVSRPFVYEYLYPNDKEEMVIARGMKIQDFRDCIEQAGSSKVNREMVGYTVPVRTVIVQFCAQLDQLEL